MSICPLMSRPDQKGNLQKVECNDQLSCAWFKSKNDMDPSPCLLLQLIRRLAVATENVTSQI